MTPAVGRLLALDDCTVMRFRRGQCYPGLTFLSDRGLCKFAGFTGPYMDVRITDKGRVEAAKIRKELKNAR